ncbi:hypothetical protein AMJ49_01365 [Parcubacteria bacterium DG_74_2]|nr:MAG: hypothetical protein AMJ49_01365 [Parcubacteria bacterium DG_74_2]
MKKFFIIFLFLFLIFVSFSFLNSTQSSKTGQFLITSGQSLKEISSNLKTEGFLKNSFLFYFYIISEKKEAHLKSGIYFFEKGECFVEMARKIIKGESYKIKITFPEGMNLKEIEAKLVENELLKTGDLESLRASQFKEDFPFLKGVPEKAFLEGFLFPDTYFFEPKEDKNEIVKIFLKNFDKKFTFYQNEVSGTGLTHFEVITMASLIEKEVKTFEEKKLASGILWKRLENNIPLQVDATITYITGKKTTKISKEETQIDSPYNTYKYLGFPPGPISNPGLESIEAAIYPKKSNYWYYLSTPEGKTIFSKTLEEHNIAKAKYLK